MKFKIISAAIIVFLTGVICYLLFFGKDVPAHTQQKMMPPPTEVTVHTIKTEKLSISKDLPGRTSAFQIAEIRPQVTGIILKRLFTEGSYVNKGDQLYQIEPSIYRANYNSMNASLAKAEADLKAVQPKLERYSRLVKIGGVSQQAYDDVVASFTQAEAGVMVAKANLAKAKIDLDYTRVFAPISGRIGRSTVTEGALVTSNQATPLATIQNIDKIYVDVNQPGSDIMKLKKNMNESIEKPKAVLLLDDQKEPYEYKGEILFSDVTVDSSTGMVKLRILFPNPNGHLLPGLFVKARVIQEQYNDAILIPQQSVVRDAQGNVTVWAVDGQNTVNIRKIMVSKVVGDKWLVSEGLKSGDKVVVEGLQKIRPMAKVKPLEYKSNS